MACFAVATILFTPQLRSFKIYQPIAFYFLFEGLCSLLTIIVNTIWVNSIFMLLFNSFGTLIFCTYILVFFYSHYIKNKE